MTSQVQHDIYWLRLTEDSCLHLLTPLAFKRHTRPGQNPRLPLRRDCMSPCTLSVPVSLYPTLARYTCLERDMDRIVVEIIPQILFILHSSVTYALKRYDGSTIR
jgi:hypothetical protein